LLHFGIEEIEAAEAVRRRLDQLTAGSHEGLLVTPN